MQIFVQAFSIEMLENRLHNVLFHAFLSTRTLFEGFRSSRFNRIFVLPTNKSTRGATTDGHALAEYRPFNIPVEFAFRDSGSLGWDYDGVPLWNPPKSRGRPPIPLTDRRAKDRGGRPVFRLRELVCAYSAIQPPLLLLLYRPRDNCTRQDDGGCHGVSITTASFRIILNAYPSVLCNISECADRF